MACMAIVNCPATVPARLLLKCPFLPCQVLPCLRNRPPPRPSLARRLCLVACCPGGSAAGVVGHLAGADVPLSVLLATGAAAQHLLHACLGLCKAAHNA